ncbi:response regulator [bacterium]|nr:response regulator [bacterium]
MAKEKIIVVEDESIVAFDIENILKNYGYSVPAVINNGEEAVKKSEEIHPDLVLMDINLKGGIDGVEAAEIINHQLNIPVIYLTAYSDDETLKRAIKTNPYGYIPKPIDSMELHTLIVLTLNSCKMKKTLEMEFENKI